MSVHYVCSNCVDERLVWSEAADYPRRVTTLRDGVHWRRRRLLPTRLMSNRNLFYATVAMKTLLISSMFGESCVDRLKTFSIFEANRVHLMDIHTKVLHGNLFGRRQSKYQIISAATFVVENVFIDTRLHSNGT